MFIDDWNSFYEQAEQLYRSDPLRTRYVMKYKHTSGKVVLKVTDDRVCLQYRTDQQADLKKIEKLNNLFFSLMAASGHDAAADPSGEADGKLDADNDTVMEGQGAGTAEANHHGSNHKATSSKAQGQQAGQRPRNNRRQ